MFSKISLLVTVALSSSLPAMATSMTQPQNVRQCAGHGFSVSGTPPFEITIWPGCDQDSTSETPLASYQTSSSQFVWNVNQKAGTSLQFVVVDATNNEYYTDDFIVGKSNDASCLGKPAKFADGSNPASLTSSTTTTTTSSTTSSTSTTPDSLGAPTTQTTPTAPLNVQGKPSETSTTTTPIKGGSLGQGGAVGSFHVPLGAITLLVLVGSVFVTF